ncbi:MAG: immunoglobulin domain-containing protein [Limisphaerales bacterium]
MRLLRTAHCCAVLAINAGMGSLGAQTLSLPPRAGDAPTGSQLTNVLWQLPLAERERWLYAQVISGNVPGWLRALRPVTVTSGTNTATYHVTPDYLAVGSDSDYLLAPMTPVLAQRLADRLGCTLPTRRMVNQIWTNAAVKLTPQPIAPGPEMTTVPVFATHNQLVRTQRDTFTNAHPPGALVVGHKKDVILSNELTNRPPPPRVILYGWHYPDGSVIQPLSAVHEETYADYSHGIRLVQMSLTVNGAANTVTNVLASPTLAGLLSDEGVIGPRRYPVAPFAPVVMTPPRARRVAAGSTASFTALVIGDAPLGYQWLRDGAALPGATNHTLHLATVQPADAGFYSILASNAAGAVTSRAAWLRVRTNAFPALFADTFTSGSETNWTLRWGATNGVPDYTAQFAFDHRATPFTFQGTTALIPPAPGSADGTAHALRLTVNNNDALAATAAVNLYAANLNVGENFALRFDLWLNYPGNAGGVNATGSTEFAICGIHHAGTHVNWAAPGLPASDGVWFALSGEGGAAADYRAFAGAENAGPVELTGSPAASGLVATNHTAAFFQALFPASRFETSGAPGKQWIEVEIRQSNGLLTWRLDDAIVAQRTNTPPSTRGTILLGLMDTFPSIASPARDAFALFANVRVENLAPPIALTHPVRSGNHALTFHLESAPGDSFVIERSTNLSAWLPLATVALTNSPQLFTDTNPPLGAAFYRARR